MTELDASTPRSVWLEYEAMKALIDRRYDRHRLELERQRNLALTKVAHELGAGTPPDELTPEQRAHWERCEAKWCQCPGDEGAEPRR